MRHLVFPNVMVEAFGHCPLLMDFSVYCLIIVLDHVFLQVSSRNGVFLLWKMCLKKFLVGCVNM